ncbi:MAG: RES family NAD+ phosphorylase [Elusimicrobiota bacterium]|nr:MAG: RES family NAD+ phosphorylase [Elusimicrobiota bacterium]
MNVPVRAVSWSTTYRVIPTRYGEERILRKLADAEDLDAVTAVERMTNDRRRQEDEEVSLVAARDVVKGPGSEFIMAAFTYRNREGSRFSDGSYGVYYTAKSKPTAIAETKHHREIFMSRTKEGPMRLEMCLLTAALEGDLHDVRGLQRKLAGVYHRTNYAASRALAKDLVLEDSFGIVYDSVRHKGGECAAVFRASVLSGCKPAGLLAFDWNGTEISKVYELREYK